MYRNIGRLFRIRSLDELKSFLQKDSDNEYRPMKAVVLCTSSDTQMVNYIRDNWEKLDGVSANFCDIFALVGPSVLKLYDSNGRNLPDFPPMEVLENIRDNFTTAKLKLTYPSLILFNWPHSDDCIVISCADADESELDAIFQETLAEIRYLQDKHYFYITSDLLKILRKKFKRRRFWTKLKLAVYELPWDKFVKGVINAPDSI